MIIAVVDQRRERSLPAGMTKEDIIKKELHWSKPLRSGHRNKANTAEGLASDKPGNSGKHLPGSQRQRPW